jgi:hypothetical protein
MFAAVSAGAGPELLLEWNSGCTTAGARALGSSCRREVGIGTVVRNLPLA